MSYIDVCFFNSFWANDIKDSSDNKQIERDEELNKNNYDDFNSNFNNIPLLERIKKKFNVEARGIIAQNNKKIKHTKNFINFKENIKTMGNDNDKSIEANEEKNESKIPKVRKRKFLYPKDDYDEEC